MAAFSVISSPLSDLLKIEHPIILAGMAVVSSPPLAAAVSNAGGLGVIGAGFPEPSPDKLRRMIEELHGLLHDKQNFGVDLLIPQVGGNARKTNKDYTQGFMPEMIDIICESRCKLFVSAVGVPPKWMTDKLHASGIAVMNMVGSPKHVNKALDSGVDIICAQGTEAGGHTGEIGTMVLLPQVVDLCRGRKSPLTGGPVHVVAAGGIYNGRTVAAALALGAEAVWVGTRFLASDEATATKMHKQTLVEASADDTMRSCIATGRPARLYKSPYVLEWETTRKNEQQGLLDKGVVPMAYDFKNMEKNNQPIKFTEMNPLSFSQSVGGIKSIEPVEKIMKDMVAEAHEAMLSLGARVRAKL
jgi:hypothetical protein